MSAPRSIRSLAALRQSPPQADSSALDIYVVTGETDLGLASVILTCSTVLPPLSKLNRNSTTST
jgi:hypothetical protein